MGKLKTLAIDLAEYEDEIYYLLQYIKHISPSTINFMFNDSAFEFQINAALKAFCVDNENDDVICEITAIAIGMKLIDKETLKVIPLEVTNDINT